MDARRSKPGYRWIHILGREVVKNVPTGKRGLQCTTFLNDFGGPNRVNFQEKSPTDLQNW